MRSTSPRANGPSHQGQTVNKVPSIETVSPSTASESLLTGSSQLATFSPRPFHALRSWLPEHTRTRLFCANAENVADSAAIWMAPGSDVATLKVGMFFAGFFTVAQFSFWGNYLPRVYPTHLRGTGEGFAANVGGRMIGTSFAYVATTLASGMSGPPHVQLAMAAATVALFVYAGGVLASFWLPEPQGEALPE